MTQSCRRCEGTFDAPVGGYCSDACLREGLPARLAAIWDRMPADSRARTHNVFGCGVMTIEQAIELWESADRNERRGIPGERHDAVAKEAQQDEFDELLVTRATNGEYGPEARQAVSDCMNSTAHGASRRAFIRAVRKAIESRRHGKKNGRATSDQIGVPLGATGTGERDPRLSGR